MDIQVDTRELTQWCQEAERTQIPFAASLALNKLAESFQVAQRAFDAGIFTLRRKDWADRSIKITHFANKRDLVATVAVESPGGGDRSDILGKFESQTTKAPHAGGTIAIPMGAKRNKLDIIPKSERPKALHFTGASGRMLGRGDKRTFILQLKNGDKAIFRRIGKRSKKGGRMVGPRLRTHDPNLVLLYYLKPSVHIHPDLHFHDHAQEVANTQWARLFGNAWAEAIRTMKPIGAGNGRVFTPEYR